MKTDARIAGIASHLPTQSLTNEMLSAEHPEWSVDKIAAKTGIAVRRIADPEETAGDLAVAAAERLFASGATRRDEIDFVILCTQSPDFFLPTTACLLQDRLGISTASGAFDFNLGCSGFVYGLSIAKGLVETGQAACVLLLTAETYSKFLHPSDHSVRTIFGDGAAATVVRMAERPDAEAPSIGPFVFGTDGSGGRNLIVPAGGMRARGVKAEGHNQGLAQDRYLSMNGGEIFAFTLRTVTESVRSVLVRANLGMDDIDWFVFHQANAWMLEHLRRKVGIPRDKFVVHLEHCGNTVSSTIPIALEWAAANGDIRPGHRLLVSGFGVGYSWASALAVWR